MEKEMHEYMNPGSLTVPNGSIDLNAIGRLDDVITTTVASITTAEGSYARLKRDLDEEELKNLVRVMVRDILVDEYNVVKLKDFIND